MGDIDNRSVGYWIHQLWHALQNGVSVVFPPGAQVAISPQPVTVKGIGTTSQTERIDVGLMFNRVDAHVAAAGTGAAVTLLAPAGARRILVQADGGEVRITLDGTDPSATVGFKFTDGATPLALPLGADVAIKWFAAIGVTFQYQWLD